jgi:3-isopropylmalate/(R)-2-methylmalate dehydratase small subunit
MSKITQITGKGVPVVGNDIDTDRIIPARFLRCVTFDGLGEQVFADDRLQARGKHPFDLPEYQSANILIVNANFGCGSSREHAPQALAKWGIQAIVGESFAEIFFGNCIAIGIPCAIAKPETIAKLQQLLQENPQHQIEVDLQALSVRCHDLIAKIAMNEGVRQMLLTGTWDSCAQLVNRENQIKATASKLPYLSWQTS